MFFLRDGMNDPLYLEDSFGNLARVLPIFNEEKTQEKMGDMLFANTKRMNLKVSMSPILDSWNHGFSCRKAIKELSLRLHVHRRTVFFASLPSRRLC